MFLQSQACKDKELFNAQPGQNTPRKDKMLIHLTKVPLLLRLIKLESATTKPRIFSKFHEPRSQFPQKPQTSHLLSSYVAIQEKVCLFRKQRCSWGSKQQFNEEGACLAEPEVSTTKCGPKTKREREKEFPLSTLYHLSGNEYQSNNEVSSHSTHDFFSQIQSRENQIIGEEVLTTSNVHG